jgi:DNA-binding MarR family transcriptional regulator
MNGNQSRKLKRAVIKEELVALTGDWLSALILNQFLYWGERVKDFDQFILEERERDPETKIELTHGWIYKTGKDLNDELMIDVAETTTRRRIQKLVEQGWIDERHNPERKWDRTLQYRPNIRRIQADLQKLGYTLDRYPLLSDAASILHGAECILHHAESILHGAESNLHSAESNLHGAESNLHGAESILHHAGAIPEITTEITAETTEAEITAETTEAKTTASKQVAAAADQTDNFEARKQMLQNLGYDARTADTLAHTSSLETIAGWIAHIQRSKTIKNPPGFLRRKLEAGEVPPRPAGWRIEDPGRYISGEYAEFVNH